MLFTTLRCSSRTPPKRLCSQRVLRRWRQTACRRVFVTLVCTRSPYEFQLTTSADNVLAMTACQTRGQVIRILLKTKGVLCVWNIFCNFRLFFTSKLKMHIRWDNQSKTGAEEGTIFGQPILFECMGIGVLSRCMNVKWRAPWFICWL